MISEIEEDYKMDQSRIDQEYKTFMIPEERIPFYDNPESFAGRFKKFTLLQEVNTVYSDNSAIQTTLDLGRKG
jgi:hypothetical protein